MLDDDDDSENDSEDELQSDNIVVTTRRPTAARELPKRSTRSNVSYASPKRPKKSKKKSAGSKTSKLRSDLANKLKGAKEETERSRIHGEIAELTEPRRKAFLFANKEYFLPLLPTGNYFSKVSPPDRDIALSSAAPVQPEGVTAVMKDYQLEGLAFLVYMHNNGMSSILGDEMGLGKTLQTLSLFQHLKNSEPAKCKNRPMLVICPLSVLTSWINEAKRWVPGLNVVRFHGPKSERERLKADCRHHAKALKIDILVTTYESFVAEQGWFKSAFVYRYCVLDEGHKIKNSDTNAAQALQNLKTEYRLVLTGTPLQNNLLEMWALLHWLYPEVFTVHSADSFKRAFDLTRGKVSTSFMDDARRLLELVMLRRMKQGVGLDLPPKTEVVLYVPLTPVQRFWYTRLLTKTDKSTLDEIFGGSAAKEADARAQEDAAMDRLITGASESEARNAWAESRQILETAVEAEQQNEQETGNKGEWKMLMNMVMQLRKCCTHPYMLPNAEPKPYYLGEHVKTASGKFIVLDKLVEELVLKQGKKILIFSSFTSTLDLCEDLLMLKGANVASNAAFRYLRLDGGTARARRNLGIRMFNDPQSEFRVMLISTRAGGLGINLASASDVVFLDEDWNPQVTLQAEARAHRIGQTKPVTIYKILSAGTVEEQMMGRIRKKLYLSTKITESMRNIHSEEGRKRKRDWGSEAVEDEDQPQMSTSSLKTLLRRGAQTLVRPEIDVTEMLSWDWQTTLDKCKDKPLDPEVADVDESVAEKEEQSWLNSMEKVECAVFEGKKHEKQMEQEAKKMIDLSRADRRLGKNTTVMIDGFAINKESLNCADWEAVPTMAGKDPRLAEPVRAKKAAIEHQEFCQSCRGDGTITLCSGCPRAYHAQCLGASLRRNAVSGQLYCPQHECVDCHAKTADAGGLIYRCRWCENGYCEDCLDWDVAKLIGATLPEYELLGFGAQENAWYIECQQCLKHWSEHEEDKAIIAAELEQIDAAYGDFLADRDADIEILKVVKTASAGNTPSTVSEVSTPRDVEFEVPAKKRRIVNS